jgi:hypothetical protein
MFHHFSIPPTKRFGKYRMSLGMGEKVLFLPLDETEQFSRATMGAETIIKF